jgi:hypothetical protein
MSRWRNLEELLLTKGLSSRGIFDYLFEPLESYAPKNNSNPPPEMELDATKQTPFPSLVHLSVSNPMEIHFFKLFALISKLVPLRGLHSLSFQERFTDTAVYMWIFFICKPLIYTLGRKMTAFS